MNSSIESVLASQYVQDRIRQADATRQARSVPRRDRADKPGRRWFRRSGTVVAGARALHSGR